MRASSVALPSCSKLALTRGVAPCWEGVLGGAFGRERARSPSCENGICPSPFGPATVDVCSPVAGNLGRIAQGGGGVTLALSVLQPIVGGPRCHPRH